MTTANTPGAPHWSNRLAFILAATGSAVGLGNIWKFPYITGEYGGGAFVLVYLFCIALIGLPLMMAEILVGRRGGSSPSLSFRHLAEESGASSAWSFAGTFGVLASFLILTFYSVIGGWAIAYLWHAIAGAFEGGSVESIQTIFNQLLASPLEMTLWHTLFMFFAVFVVSRGVHRGIERAVTILMPAMFVLLLVLVVYAFTTGGASASLNFLFSPDFSKLTMAGVLTALGHAFFTLSLGMSNIVTYGSYLPRHISITGASVTVSLLDTVVALLAGVAIFSVVFANSMEPGAGPGLVFQTLPLAFGSMTGGHIIGIAFFFMLVFAAWSSAISLTEACVSRVTAVYHLSRRKAALITGIVAWTVGLLSVLSFNTLADFKPVSIHGEPKTIFDFLDFLTTNIMLPLTGLMVAVFVGWIMNKKFSLEELESGEILHNIWMGCLRYITPVLVLIVFIYNVLPRDIQEQVLSWFAT